MSDPEDLYLNELFSTVPPPDGGLLLPPAFPEQLEPAFPEQLEPIFFEHFEPHFVPWPHEYTNDYVFSDAMELSGHFQVDNDVLMPVDPTPGPAQYIPTDTVGDTSSGLFLDSSDWSNENPTHFMNPTLLAQSGNEYISDLTYDIPFLNSYFFDGEIDPLGVAEPIQPETMTSTMPQSVPEGLESRVIESQVSISSDSEVPAITSAITSQKRKHLGPSRDYELPPLKKGGRRGQMTETEREDRKRVRKQGPCITCRTRKTKCDGEVPCSSCLQNLGPKLSRQPCTKATFLPIVEQNPCFEFANIYQTRVIKTSDNTFFLQQFATALSLAERRFSLELVPGIPLDAGVFTMWDIAAPMFMLVFNNATSTGLPPLAPLMITAPTELKKLEGFNRTLPYVFNLPSRNLDARTLFQKKLFFCASRSRTFRVYDSTGKIHDMGDNEAVRNAAQLLDWLAIRHLEMDMFCYLQNSVNKLHKASTSDLHSIIGSLIGLVELLSKYWERSAKFFPERMALDQETIGPWIERHQRLYMALFVYLQIAISKLPSWSSFWGEQEKLSLKFTAHEFRDMFSHFESFKSKMEAKEQEIQGALDHLELQYKILKEFDPKFEEEDDDQWEVSEEFFKFLRRLQSGQVDQEFEEFDRVYTDGLVSATMSGNFDEVRVSKFFSLANIDWELAIERLSLGHVDTDDVNGLLLFHLSNNILRSRLHMTRECSIVAEQYALVPEEFVQDLRALTVVLLSKNPEKFDRDPEALAMILSKGNTASYRKRRKQVLSFLREGLRWLELKRLIGEEEEIYLLDNPLECLKPGDKLPLVDIPWALQNGDDEDFDQLKRLLVTSQSWVRETCVQLRGIVSLITEALIAYKSDKDAALNLSRLIQQKVKSVFGDDVLHCQSTESRFKHKLTSSLGVSSDEVNRVIGVVLDRKDAASFNEDEDEDEDDEDDEDDDETAPLIKSIQSLLCAYPNPPS